MEKLWQYIYSGGSQIILQWQGGQTRTGRWISCSQRHREHCHELPSTLKQPYHYPPEGKTIYITIIQAYAPTSDYDGDAVEDFYERLQEILDHSLKNGTLVVLGDWNAKVGEDALKKLERHMWALLQPKDKRERLLLRNTLGKHKASKRCPTRIKFDLEKLKNPQVPESFQAMISGMIDW